MDQHIGCKCSTNVIFNYRPMNSTKDVRCPTAKCSRSLIYHCPISHDDISDFELKKAHHTSPAGELWCAYYKYSRRLTARYWDRPVFSSQTKANSFFWVHQNRLVQMPSTSSIISVFFRWNALWNTLTIIMDWSAHFDYKDTIVMIYIYLIFQSEQSSKK